MHVRTDIHAGKTVVRIKDENLQCSWHAIPVSAPLPTFQSAGPAFSSRAKEALPHPFCSEGLSHAILFSWNLVLQLFKLSPLL